jgi:hypothetical protein
MSRTLLAGVAALLLITPSCSESAAASAAGTYKVDLGPTLEGAIAAVPGGDKLPAEAKEQMKSTMEPIFTSMSLVLNADMTYQGMQGSDEAAKGTWSLDGNKLTVKTTHENGKEKASTQTGTYKDGKITMDMEKDGQKITLHMVKQKK